MGDRITMSRRLATWVVVCATVLVGAGSAQAQVSFDRAFGIGVATGAGFENCTTASGCQAGAPSGAAGGMNFPQGVAVDAQGRILVADSFNHRIARYVVAGDGTVTFDRAFGMNVDPGGGTGFENCTTASGCQGGTASGAAGGMRSPVGVAVDAQGRILVADTGNRRIDRYVVAGDGTVAFDRAFGMNVDPGGGAGFENCTTASGCQAGTGSGAAGGMILPTGVAVDALGRILVANLGNSRIDRYVVAGDGTVAFDRAFGMDVDPGGGAGFENCTTASGCQGGTASGAAGGMRSPDTVAIDAQGRIVVADESNNRIDRYVVAGDGTVAFDRAFGMNVDPGGGTGFENCTTASGCQGGTASGAAGGMNVPAGAAVDAQGRIVVADFGNNRIARYVVAGDGTVAFDRAFGMNVDPGGGTGFENCTTANGCQAGTASGTAGGMSSPQGVAVDAQGRILVAESSNSSRVDRFISDPALVPALSTWGLALLTLTLLGLGARRMSRSRATPSS